MSKMNPKEVIHNTAYSVQLSYLAVHSLYQKIIQYIDYWNIFLKSGSEIIMLPMRVFNCSPVYQNYIQKEKQQINR